MSSRIAKRHMGGAGRAGRRPGLGSGLCGAVLAWACLAAAALGPAHAQEGDDEALLALVEGPWTGDLDGMYERGTIRVLTAYNPLLFFYDGVEQKGFVAEVMTQFQERLDKQRAKDQPPLRVVIIPVARDVLLPALLEGRGDLVVANLTITPKRSEIVRFSDPLYPDVSELVVTGPGSAPISSLDDLAETPLHLRPSSSYQEHLTALNAERKASGKPEIPVQAVDEILEDFDLLEMVNAGLIPAVVVDSRKAAFWAQLLDDIVVHEDVALHRGGNIAWALRKDSPRLLAAVNAFVKEVRKGTLLGNILLKRYLVDTKWIDNALEGDGWQRHREIVDHIRRYAGEYDFDWMMIAAQGYQESKLDQSRVSPVGAIGVMQIMPATAADPNVGIPDIEKVGPNVNAGVKYLRFLRDRYFDDPLIDPADQVLFGFAAYNAGPGNIAKARRKAAAMGLDPNKWFRNVEIAASRTISREPVIYVRNIFKYYTAYKMAQNHKAEREAAKQAPP